MAFFSTNKISNMMLDILLQLPTGTKNLKDNVSYNLGMVAQMSTTRDINTAWNGAKKKAAKQYPEKFILDDRNVLQWNDGSSKALDKKISNKNYKKLNEIADNENCTVESLITKLISQYNKQKKL